MTKLLIQGDDFGFTKGVTYGIADAIDCGVLRNTGLFANMPAAALAAEPLLGAAADLAAAEEAAASKSS